MMIEKPVRQHHRAGRKRSKQERKKGNRAGQRTGSCGSRNSWPKYCPEQRWLVTLKCPQPSYVLTWEKKETEWIAQFVPQALPPLTGDWSGFISLPKCKQASVRHNQMAGKLTTRKLVQRDCLLYFGRRSLMLLD
ncbi:uncharacterized protein PGTG_02638 [Puccinia graminis f. sp. tritici CRL 75-36-700-3]|uniref:Uncharacterized protein n=1 Tax=Puccinia graminis f. sp. tritici (strain CRL 75-36-700-3 / race SCCL) TaxID=418459 RepID=E3JVX2_PUCGT|nr:uncharacterized protein PGTG_02638 [Puccinia graminis f. sp. tritici CRL 75-36-700-3]EFP76197.1 hypothetical protein PGTG_02638 [Puccinia graminis f. sp. tritici CRL 75-36-700-3]